MTYVGSNSLKNISKNIGTYLETLMKIMVAFVNIKKRSLAHDPAPVSVKIHFPKFNFISGFCLVAYYLQNYNVL